MANLLTHDAEIPNLGITVKLHDHRLVTAGHPTRRYGGVQSTNVVDWTKNGRLKFPILGNATYGNCEQVSACHFMQTTTGNHGPQMQFDVHSLIPQYLAVAGGGLGPHDWGWTEGLLIPVWENPGLGGNPQAIIWDALDIDPGNPETIKSAIWTWGGVILNLALIPTWLTRFHQGVVWDATGAADLSMGHSVLLNGVDKSFRFRFQCWGHWGWLTLAGLAACYPSLFTVSTPTWFGANGMAPNGLSRDAADSDWQQWGGKPFPVAI